MTPGRAISGLGAVLAGVGLGLLSGCAGSAVFDERSNGQTVDVAQGTVFQVSLPGAAPGLPPNEVFTWGEPHVAANFVSLQERRNDLSSNRVIFSFRAELRGEGELRFVKIFRGDPRERGEYTIKVRIRTPEEVRMITSPTH
jgi:hypothetical protein